DKLNSPRINHYPGFGCIVGRRHEDVEDAKRCSDRTNQSNHQKLAPDNANGPMGQLAKRGSLRRRALWAQWLTRLEHGDFSQPRITIASGLTRPQSTSACSADYKAPARRRVISRLPVTRHALGRFAESEFASLFSTLVSTIISEAFGDTTTELPDRLEGSGYHMRRVVPSVNLVGFNSTSRGRLMC